MQPVNTSSSAAQADLVSVAQRRIRVSVVMFTGIGLFILLYILAAVKYPGGSTIDPAASGFDIRTNYWCDLLGSQAKNGRLNPARPFAVTAMVLLALTLAYFWYITPQLFGFVGAKKWLLQVAGVLAMGIAPFIMTVYHDTVINIAGLLGAIALLGTLHGLYKQQARWLWEFGVVCLALGGLNRYIYQTSQFIDYLPVVQKITFILFLLWFGQIGLHFRRHSTSIL